MFSVDVMTALNINLICFSGVTNFHIDRTTEVEKKKQIVTDRQTNKHHCNSLNNKYIIDSKIERGRERKRKEQRIRFVKMMSKSDEYKSL